MKKGMTLTSVIIYVVVMLIIVGTVGTITGFFYSSTQNLEESADSLGEFNKFNAYFLEETKLKDNKVASIEENKIIFTSGTSFSFVDGAIYRNKVKICSSVNACRFVIYKQEEKNVIQVYLEIGSNFVKTIEYVMDFETIGSVGQYEENYAGFLANNTPNEPKLVDGMTPIKFTLPVKNDNTDTVGTTVVTDKNDIDWYNYDQKRWANARTVDGSMWVWIPRYAYRINNISKTTEVVFLLGTSDNYYDANGNLQTAKRCTSTTDPVDTTTGFTVHPAFTNESSIGYRNGGWNEELTGMWVAKFEAGYASGNNNAPVVASNVKYEQAEVWGRYMEVSETATGDNWISARNWLDGIYGGTTTAIKYPTFQPLTYSMNYINHSDAYELSRDLTSANNIYGFTSYSANTHLMKDSEWGMVAYFSQSKYRIKWSRYSSKQYKLK